MFSRPVVKMAQPTRRFRSRCKILLGCAISGLVLAARTLAQTSVEDVHVKPLSGITANQSSQKSALTSAVRSFKTRADLVIVPVSVTDAANRPVLGLEKENFQVYENKRPQTVLSYSTEDAPVSIGIVLDESGSMQNKLGKAREAINNLVSTANPDDEFFLITFSDKPVQILDFDSSAEQIKNELLYTVAKGSTALFDAVYLAIRKMEKANFSRKAILIVSDGEDNHSHYTENEIRNVAREADILIYGIGIFDAFVDPFDGQVGPEVLAQLSALTGGRTFVIQNPKDLVDAADRIGFELRNLYILSYTPQETSRDGKWHKIKVKLTLPKGLPALRVHAREGYYATAE